MIHLILSILFGVSLSHAKVRRVVATGDQVVPVRTSLGIATIVQVPDRPNSVVVGDQDSFKVEYLDQAITIKPLSSGARSNLYVYTDWKRYNVELISGSQSEADYVVYLTDHEESKPTVKPESCFGFKNHLRNEHVDVILQRICLKNEFVLVEFRLLSSVRTKFKPEWIWLTQNEKAKTIHQLIVSELDLDPEKQVHGLLVIKRTDLEPVDIKIELRRKKTSFMTIPKRMVWKNF